MNSPVRSALETAIIVAGIASFWPYTAGYRSVWYQAGLVLALPALIALAVIRWRRFRRALSELDNGDRKR
ncbi:MAG: hypothetical protein HZB26_17145 [Candidatus Hydrogenedentes bacterium]|nr:hypothetical protein [Candidatus Hydrogenedentota bacterium]